MKPAKDYIVFPLDVPTLSAGEKYVQMLSDAVGMFKVGLELFIRCGPEIIARIQAAGAAKIFLDLKLHDIPATVERAMARIADLGVDFATVHCAESARMLEAAVAGSKGRVRVLGVTVLTSVSPEDIRRAGYRPEFAADISTLVMQKAAMARAAGLAGIVCSGQEVKPIKAALGKDFIAVTPGIRPAWEAMAQDDQQRVTTPAQAVANGSDYLVIGRPIRDASSPRAAAARIAAEIEALR